MELRAWVASHGKPGSWDPGLGRAAGSQAVGLNGEHAEHAPPESARVPRRPSSAPEPRARTPRPSASKGRPWSFLGSVEGQAHPGKRPSSQRPSFPSGGAQVAAFSAAAVGLLKTQGVSLIP